MLAPGERPVDGKVMGDCGHDALGMTIQSGDVITEFMLHGLQWRVRGHDLRGGRVEYSLLCVKEVRNYSVRPEPFGPARIGMPRGHPMKLNGLYRLSPNGFDLIGVSSDY